MNKHKNIPDNFRVLLSGTDPACVNEEHDLKALTLNEDTVQVPSPLRVYLLDPGQVLQLGHQIHTLHVVQEENGGLG